ncbi:glycosyltransferase family 4 protein [Glaciimonas immobilis]|uniref:Glycosyltransferase involved in cell wall biosynthesis n=1 Tax=Glaciimonas immobilis TaxID=728004 RepID=A0A840RQ68_9BURK|nr:glycosyltransferase family 4 protein [Glaciimonas immobilis]KAF3998164.1 glycosyltransferase family 4 protein [Glaciimonas immobilis]MBB5199128.1 glycosyltransferase involved in cell wall biosynthesis [Glaciimonas immobilis]
MEFKAKKLRVLVVHSSAELYGSDRSLLDFVRNRNPDMEFTVALPEHGILVRELENAGAMVIVGEVCKIERAMLSPLGMLRLTKRAVRSVFFLTRVHRNISFDLVYSNTVAVMGGAFCARLWRIPHVWHVRELLEGSRALTWSFRHLVAKLSAVVVCNSAHTRDWISVPSAAEKYCVIWNGYEAPEVKVHRQIERASLGAGERDILFVLVGRINAWKGQQLLVHAFSRLIAKTACSGRLAIVGSAPVGQEHYERDLDACITRMNCAERVVLIPYHADIERVWIAADIVVVPSTSPEPFGRVAIEAMGFGRPVIAAAHGGLLEIVVHGETGYLVNPCDVDALAAAMEKMINDADLRQRMGDAGRARQLERFSLAAYETQMNEVIWSTSHNRQRSRTPTS